jgi:hypothetical protein
MALCKCGGEAKYVCSWGMDDQFVCTKCDYKTRNYFDGAEYARSEWNRRNDPNYPKPALSSFARAMLEGKEHKGKLRGSRGKITRSASAKQK